jgi:hypothetical protein
MPRALLVLILATMMASLAIGAQTQTPAAPSNNVAPTISLSTQPARQVFSVGERFTVVAAASDNSDPPERLQYRWIVKNLESGVEQAARDTTLRQVRTSGRTPGNYEYKCIVTDTAGASGEATLVVKVEDTGNPEVVGLAFDDSTGALHRVTPFWRAGFPAIRRGDWAVILVSVRNFVAGPHVLKVFVDGKQAVAGGPGSAWAVQNLGGTTTERIVRLFVPPDVGVGKHSIEVAAFTRAGNGGAETEVSRIAYSPEPFVLFNPWRSPVADASVYAGKPLSNDHATFYTRGTQDLVMSSIGSESVYDVTPHDKAVVSLAQEIVAGMPADARADAGRVAAAMAAHVGERDLPDKPRLTALLRSVGIPARAISVIDSGRDREPPLGVLQTKYDCQRWNGALCEDPQTPSTQEQPSFDTWNQVWIPGTMNDGWVAAGNEAPNLPWEIWWKAQGSWYEARGAAGTTAQAFVTDTSLKRSTFSLASTQEPSPLQITAGPVVSLRSGTTVKISASGLGTAPSRLGFGLLRLPRELSGGTPEATLRGGLVFATLLDVRPSGGTWTGSVEVPGDVLAVAGAYEVVVGPQEGTAGPSGRTRFDVDGLPIAVALPARVTAGAAFAVSARLANSTSAPIQGATLRLVLPSQLRVVDGSASSAKTIIPIGGDLRINAMVQAIAPGKFLVGAASDSSAGPSEEYAQILVSYGGRLHVDGEPALGVKAGETVTVKANVILDAPEAVNEVEARLDSVEGAPITILNDSRKLNATLAPDDTWTPSWQVLVTTPGTYRLPVRVRTTGLGEAGGEIVLVAGASDPDADLTDDFNDEESLGYRSPKAIAGVAAVVLTLLGGAGYLIRRRMTPKRKASL